MQTNETLLHFGMNVVESRPDVEQCAFCENLTDMRMQTRDGSLVVCCMQCVRDALLGLLAQKVKPIKKPKKK